MEPHVIACVCVREREVERHDEIITRERPTRNHCTDGHIIVPSLIFSAHSQIGGGGGGGGGRRCTEDCVGIMSATRVTT
jgi:hypothetical protein